MARIEAFLPSWHGLPGRPLSERTALARAFIAKSVFNLPTTRLLIDMLSADKTLRYLCGWQRAGEVPSEATFSLAFAEFATSALPSRLHAALIQETHKDRLVGHISRDSTAIDAREKPVKLAACRTYGPRRFMLESQRRSASSPDAANEQLPPHRSPNRLPDAAVYR